MDPLENLKEFAHTKGWEIIREREIQNGHQVVITDGAHRVPVNVFDTGTIQIQGKVSPLQEEIIRWKEAFFSAKPKARNRSATYSVFSDKKREDLWNNVIYKIPGAVPKEVSGLAETHRVEIRRESLRVTITQYQSGNLLVQGLDSPLFEEVCDILDAHLEQDFTQRAQRFIPEGPSWEQVFQGIEPSLENQAISRLKILLGDPAVLEFLHEKDRKHLLAGAGILALVEQHNYTIPDYSPVVTGFAKAFEGFMIRLALHLGLTSQEKIEQGAKNIKIGDWIEEVEQRLPDPRRYKDVSTALDAAWQARNKAVHSDPFHPYSVIETLQDALDEIKAIIRAMKRAFRVFIQEGIALSPKGSEGKPQESKSSGLPQKFTFLLPNRDALRSILEKDGFPIKVRAESDRNVWEHIGADLKILAPRHSPNTLIVTGPKASEFVRQYTEHLILVAGTDEAGKGDVFGPLVIAAVLLTPYQERLLRREGVRDSKKMSPSQVTELAGYVRQHYPTETLVLMPEEYNEAYETHKNLNRLLAWAHAQVILQMYRRYPMRRVMVDQFGDSPLLHEFLGEAGEMSSEVEIIQQPQAETQSIAVASASIVARALFLEAMQDLSEVAGIPLQRGASDPTIKEQLLYLSSTIGAKGLRKVAKLHFRPVRAILGE